MSPYQAYQVFFNGEVGGADAGYEKQANLASCDIHDFGCSTKVNVFPYFCPEIPYFKLQTISDYFLSEQLMEQLKKKHREFIFRSFCSYGRAYYLLCDNTLEEKEKKK